LFFQEHANSYFIDMHVIDQHLILVYFTYDLEFVFAKLSNKLFDDNLQVSS